MKTQGSCSRGLSHGAHLWGKNKEGLNRGERNEEGKLPLENFQEKWEYNVAIFVFLPCSSLPFSSLSSLTLCISLDFCASWVHGVLCAEAITNAICKEGGRK